VQLPVLRRWGEVMRRLFLFLLALCCVGLLSRPHVAAAQAGLGPPPYIVRPVALALGASDYWIASAGIAFGTGVSSWTSIGPTGTVVTQATGGKQPTFTSADAAYGGLPSISCASASQQGLDSSTMPVTAQPITLFGVFTATQTTATAIVVGQYNSTSGPYVYMGNGTNPTKWEIYAGTGPLVGGSTDTNSHAFVAVFSSTSSLLYIDSSTTPNINTGNAGTQGITATPYTICNTFPGSDWWQGSVEETGIAYAAWSASNVATYFADVKRRTGLNVS
jgi:hypothetical protein